MGKQFPTDSDKSQNNQHTSSCPPCHPLLSPASCLQTWPQQWPLWLSASDKSIQEIRQNVLTPTPGYLTPWAPAGAWRGVARPAATSGRAPSTCHTHTAVPWGLLSRAATSSRTHSWPTPTAALGPSVPPRQQTSSRTSSLTVLIWFSEEATPMLRSFRWPLTASPSARPG